MTVTVYDWPHEWYDLIIAQKFPLRSLSQMAMRPWIGGRGVKGPHAQIWTCDVMLAPQRDPVLQEIGAFLERLGGQAGVLRIADALRLAPWWDRNLASATSTFSDGSTWTDGSGFGSGYLPPEVYVVNAADRGANYIVLGGFPASTDGVIRRGDRFQILPSGIPGTVPHHYKAMYSCASNAAGQVGIEIAPRLRQGVAAFDTVSLRYASSVFRLVDDTQGAIETSEGGIGSTGFSLVEALDLVP